VFAIMSSAWSPDGPLSFYKACSVGLAYMVAFLGAWSYGTNVKRVRSLADVHVDMLWLVFPLALFWYFAGMPNAVLAGRLESIFENPNAIGVWCSMGLPLAAAFGLTHPVRWRRRACWFLLVTGLVAGLLSGSRGGVMGAFLGFGLYAGMRWRRWTLVLTAAAAVAGVFLVLFGVDVLSHSSTLQTLVRPESLEGLSDRRYWWTIGMLIAKQKPYLGHGFGIGESLFVSYGLDTSQGVFPYTIHNSYLETWMELGLLGVGLLVGCQLWTVYLGLRTYRRDPDGELGLLALALTCSAVAVSAHAFVEGILLGTGNPWMVPYWVTLALVARLHRIQRDEATARQRALARQPVVPRWGPLPTTQ
jgi:O-antigen ligase